MAVQTGNGDDTVLADYVNDLIALTGPGNDLMLFNNSTVAYNPGANEDTVIVGGGNTIGNLVGDDASDTLVFNFTGGGNHAASVDDQDLVLIKDAFGI